MRPALSLYHNLKSKAQNMYPKYRSLKIYTEMQKIKTKICET